MNAVYGRRSRPWPSARWVWCDCAFFLLPLMRGETGPHALPEETSKKKQGLQRYRGKVMPQAPAPQGVVLMVSLSLPTIRGWGNLHRTYQAFLASLRRMAWTSPFFPCPVQPKVLSKSRFLVRPRLLTRLSTLPAGRALFGCIALFLRPRGAHLRRCPLCPPTTGG